MLLKTLVTSGLALGASLSLAQVPHNQDGPPGPALSPREAVQKMTLPEGFRAEVFAAEPNLVNPVSMSFDEKGRVWVVESLEYPRRDPGPGKDRVKVIEDTDQDGKADRFTIFAAGLNIPCGVAVGNGGVYVSNSPDILFLRDTDGDMKADATEVILSGFGRFDTHELPNTLTWGPDGWLYGLNGVFNGARVRHQGKEHRFDAALWRYHPRTRDFELFAEGTSNPWGVAWDDQGSAFVSACVIDHLYHLTETGYYHRQAGAYPPYTWKIESVVDHKHQKAAYCGLVYYDADVYPEAYRGRLLMGNIHGNCINVDRLERHGSTYVSHGEPDFLQANDAWFMPVATKLGPDGCLYILDWYDRYHCYQDANRDPQGIDRLQGRLYRIAYKDAPRAAPFDLAAEPSPKLVQRLGAANLWWRNEARRLLAERLAAGREEPTAAALRELVLGEKTEPRMRLHALWTLVSAEDPGQAPRTIHREFHLRLLGLADPTLRAWGVRAAGHLRQVDPAVRARVRQLVRDPAADVRLQVIIAARKLLGGTEAVETILDALAASSSDPLIPRIAWRNLEPLLGEHAAVLAAWLKAHSGSGGQGLDVLAARVTERLLAQQGGDLEALGAVLERFIERRGEAPEVAAAALAAIGKSAAGGGVSAESLARLKSKLERPLQRLIEGDAESPLYLPALALATAWKDDKALAAARAIAADAGAPAGRRSRAVAALAAADDAAAVEVALAILKEASAPGELVREVLATLGRGEAPEVATGVLAAFEALAAPARPQALDLLTQRPAWAAALIDAVEAKRLDRNALNVNQLRRMLAAGDEKLKQRVAAVWGQVRAERSPEREKVIARLRESLAKGPADPWAGKAVFEKTCAQCHVLFGKGNTVGPDITASGRDSLDMLLSNLLDPNLVIGAGYQAWTLVDRSGRVLSGLLVEDAPQRVVLKVAGGKEEVVARGEVQTLERAEVSLMPEDLEKTTTEQEFRDLIAYLRYEEAPPEPVAVTLAGGEGRAMRVTQGYGVVTVAGRDPRAGVGLDGDADFRPLLEVHHSGDGRPFIHPLHAPDGETVLTALRPDDHPWQYGVFTGHARAGGFDFWHEKGWIRSRGLESVTEHPDRVEIVARADWLSQRRGGQRVLAERQRIVVHAPRAEPGAAYAIDFEWQLTPEAELTIDTYDYGGLAFRPAAHTERKHARAAGEDGHSWQDMSGLFKSGGRQVTAGVAILDHPQNPGYPNRWRVDDQGLINPAITARGPLTLPAGKATTFRYRLFVHDGHGDPSRLDAEHRKWLAER
jgi:putative membrane-bound dehydrogenase-like protein